MSEKLERKGFMRTLALRLFVGGVAVALAGCLVPLPRVYAEDRPEQSGGSTDVSELPNDHDGIVLPDGTVEEPSVDPDKKEESEGVDEGLPDDIPDDAIGSNEEGQGDSDVDLNEGVLPKDAPTLGDESDLEVVELAEAEAEPVQSYSGATMYETAAAEAKAAYPKGCDSAIIVGPGQAWIDALSATGLAASKGPILFTEKDSLNSATKKVLKELGVKSVVIVGGEAAVSAKVVNAIKNSGIAVETRLGGADCYDTQMKIYEYGQSRGFWDPSMAIVATASHFGDALSVSPVAFAKKVPIFLVESGAGLGHSQQQALVKGARSGGFTSIAIVGGTSAVSRQAEGFISGICYWNGGSYTRLAGATQYETSAEVAAWAATSQGLSWDSLAFATGASPYDALAGSVLQGGSGSVLLLIDGSNTATLNAAVQHKSSIEHVRFLGGTAALPQNLRNTIVSKLGISTTSRPKAAPELDAEVGEETVQQEEILDGTEEPSDEVSAPADETARIERGLTE